MWIKLQNEYKYVPLKPSSLFIQLYPLKSQHLAQVVCRLIFQGSLVRVSVGPRSVWHKRHPPLFKWINQLNNGER